MTAIDIDALQAWVGRRQHVEDVLAPRPAAALAATLDHPRLPEAGDTLPPLWHWIYFTPCTRQGDLGPDGHARRGGFMPPIPLPRRMWAGGRLRFLAPLRLGEQVRRDTEILRIALKAGQQGALVIVTLKHTVSGERGLAIEEEQDLVYREPGREVMAATPATTAMPPASWRDAVVPDPVLLFRYSALTFNAHRIHYDAPYATMVEGYPGLVVHGPLTATLLAERLGARHQSRLTSFSFRGLRPLFAGAPMTLCGRLREEKAGDVDLWAETPEGAVAMSATASMA